MDIAIVVAVGHRVTNTCEANKAENNENSQNRGKSHGARSVGHTQYSKREARSQPPSPPLNLNPSASSRLAYLPDEKTLLRLQDS